MRFLSPDVALVHAGWTITGDPRAPQPRSYLMTMVVSRNKDRNSKDRWSIFAAQNGSAFDHSVLPGLKSQPGGSLPATVPKDGEMRKPPAELDDDWNRSDAPSLSHLFAEDSDLVDISAHQFHGRVAIEAQIGDLLVHSLKGTHSRTTVLTINRLSAHLAVLEVLWELKDGARGDTPMRITGLRVIFHPDGKWRIVAAQDTIARFLPPQNP